MLCADRAPCRLALHVCLPSMIVSENKKLVRAPALTVTVCYAKRMVQYTLRSDRQAATRILNFTLHQCAEPICAHVSPLIAHTLRETGRLQLETVILRWVAWILRDTTLGSFL